MIFSSLVFLCIFLPVIYFLYLLMPSLKVRNGLLIVASLFFYAYGEPIYVVLMISSAFLNYICARFIARYTEYKKLFLVIGIFFNIGMLGIFKYAAFIIHTWNRIFHMNCPSPEISLPVGISFFTFQALSYVIDVYRGTVEVQKSFWKILLYISFFPQLIAGPIIKYRDISEEINHRELNSKEAALGMRRFICGLGKKVLVANTMGLTADQIFTADLASVNIAVAWLGAIAYMLQIYYDFSGYSDMAIGLGQMFGFHFQENFLYPYSAFSIKDFWRKWHVSLSTWFKEYLYIPLGGNRKGKARTCINKIAVFLCTGLWHGANWTFVIWGLYHGVFLLLEEYLPIGKNKTGILAHIYSLVVVCVGFVIFRANKITQGLYFVKQMFTGMWFTSEANSLMWQQMTPWFLVMLLIGIIGAAPIGLWFQKCEILNKEWIDKGMYILAILLLVWCMVRLSGSSYNPFIYFRF